MKEFLFAPQTAPTEVIAVANFEKGQIGVHDKPINNRSLQAP